VTRLRIRIYLGDGHSLGPGKVQLLEHVRDLGSISAAAREMGMAYRHAWELVDDMNQCFRTPVVTATSGGREGGGARLTPFGAEVIRRFRAMERAARRAMAANLDALEAKVADEPASGGRSGKRGRAAGR
jgi:molybdate transport system regulatory protein